ncbi:MAG: hypothetical protein Q4G70_14645 [Pseudomonadota bacterium]|nr:hypothetical protein [Pseudomonadota bacterium]
MRSYEEIEAEFRSSPIGIWYRRGKILAWSLFPIIVALSFITPLFSPGCHIFEIKSTCCCNFSFYNSETAIALPLLFNLVFAIGLAVLLAIIKNFLILWFLLKKLFVSKRAN